MSHTRTLVLLDKKQTNHVILEDLTENLLKVEFDDTGAEKTNNVKITIKLNKARKYVLTEPILIGDVTKAHNDQPKDKYLIYGYITKDSFRSTEFRAYITATEQKLIEGTGNVLVIHGITQDLRTKQTLVSTPLRFFTVDKALSHRVLEYNLEQLPSLTNPAISIIKNGFPTKESLKQNWLIGVPRTLHAEFIDFEKKLFEVNVAGGVLDKYYIRMDPDTLGLGNTKNILLTAERYGEIDSGVKLDATQFTLLKDKSIITDNTKYYNHILLKAGSLGTLPQSYMRNASNFEHARRRPNWDGNSISYLKDDLVQYQNRYFKATFNHTSASGTNPIVTLGTTWEEDYVLDGSYAIWNSLEDWKANLGGFVLSHGDYAGVFVDHNYVRANYDRQEFTNKYEYITLKDVKAFQTDPPSQDVRYDGLRVLIPNTGGTGLFTGKKNQVAEWSEDDNEWKFSLVAVDNDMVYDHNSGAILQYDLASDTWSYPTDFFGDKLSWPSHPVKSVSLTDNAKGLSNSAMRFRFDWDVAENTINRFSRGFWANWFVPYPRKPTSNGAVGHLYKNPVIDTTNLGKNSKGQGGWNNGIDSMDLGKMKSLFLELRASFEDSNNDLIDFIEEIPIGVGFVDADLRVTIQDGTLRRNGQFDTVEVPVGENAPTNLYFNRLEELVKVLGISHPFFDFTLKEREFTGVNFDWNKVTGWFVFWKGAYDDNGAYSGARDQFVDDIAMQLHQAWENLVHIVLNKIGFSRASTIIHHCYLDVGDWYFTKEMYCTSSDVKLDEPITKLVRAENEHDFNNGTLRSLAELAKSSFFPQMWYIEGKGDPRLKRGHRFKAVGPEVPGGEIELVAHEVKLISDGNSFTNQVVGTIDFKLP